MCFSMCGQILFGLIMIACLILTLGAMFTPGWRDLSKSTQAALDANQIPQKQGIFAFSCKLPGDASSTTAKDSSYCKQWWENLQTWEKVVIGSMIAAVIFEVAALAWNTFTWCACCCKKYLIHPLTPLSVLSAAFLCVAVVVYGTHNENVFDHIQNLNNIKDQMKSEVGYSFYLAVAALVLAVVDILVALLTVFLGERCL